MKNYCPFCHGYIEGEIVAPHATKEYKALSKFATAKLIQIPFIGSWIGGELYKTLNEVFSDNFYLHLCPKCKLFWYDSETNDTKISGGKYLTAVFVQDSFIIGNFEKGIYIQQVKDSDNIINKVFYQQNGAIEHRSYVDGYSNEGRAHFINISTEEGRYVGEAINGYPHGLGVLFCKNGFIYLGQWSNGLRNGVFTKCKFDGRQSGVEYWNCGIVTIIG